MKKITPFLLIYFTTFFGCGQTDSQNNQIKNKTVADLKPATNAHKSNAGNGEFLKLKKYEIWDRQGTGMVAFTCLIPEGWNVIDKLYWEYNDATLPIRFHAQIENSQSNMLIQAYPDVRAVYSSGPGGTSGYPPPRGAIPGLKDMIKKERAGTNYKIIEEKIITNSPKQTGYQNGSYIESQSQSGMIRIAYADNNIPMEEEFYGQLDIANSSSQGVVTLYSTIWSANSLYSVKAPANKLNECRKIALTIKSSMKPTLAFYNKCAQVIQLLSDAVYARIYQAGQISKIISQTNDQISKSISDSYWQTQKTYERTNSQFSDAIRGVDRYSDANNTTIQLPSGYDNAWVNDRGEYLLSLNNGFDPNTQLQGNWKQLSKN